MYSNELEIWDIYNSNQQSELLLEDRAPKVEELIFDVSKHLEDILGFTASRLKTENGKAYTLTDIRNFRLHNINDVKLLFTECYWIDIETSEGIAKVNETFEKAKNIFTNRYHKILPPGIKNKQIKNIIDIQRIFQNTWKWKKWITYCALAKLFRTHITLTNDTRLQYKKHIHNEIVWDISNMIWNAVEVTSNEIEWFIKSWDENIPIRLTHRYKDNDSVVWKAIWNIAYDTVDDYRDIHGYTFEVESKEEEDYITVMHQAYWALSKKTIHEEEWDIIIKIENKWLITMVTWNKWELYSPVLNKMFQENKISQEFYIICNRWFVKSHKASDNKKTSKLSWDNYKDTKFKIMYETEDPTNKWEKLLSGTEIKIVEKWNDNEKGLAFHPIYWYAKLFRELSRLVWYIRHTDIIHFVNDFFKELDNNLKIKWVKKWEFMPDLFHDLQVKWFITNDIKYSPNNLNIEKNIRIWLYKYYESWLLKVKVSKWSKSHFYIHPSYKDLVPEIQPELENVEEK
jgi:hypothetical protein